VKVTGGSLFVPAGSYLINRLDLTNITASTGLIIEGEGINPRSMRWRARPALPSTICSI
jgi:hypothetical protein